MILTKENIKEWQNEVETIFKAHTGHDMFNWTNHWSIPDRELLWLFEGDDSLDHVEEMILTFQKEKA